MGFTDRPAERSRWEEIFARFAPWERPSARRAAKIAYGVCVTVGAIAIACFPWLFVLWLLSVRNEALGVATLISAGLSVLTLVMAGWFKAKAGGYVNF